MADTYVIETVFKAHDQMSASIQSLTSRTTKFGNRLERAFEKGTLGATKFKTVLGGVLGANLITAGIGRIRQAMGSLTDEFLNFDAAITSAASKYKFDRGTKEFEALGKAARDVASQTPYTAGQAAKALDYLAMAGFGAQQAMSALPGVTNLAIAGQMDLAQASDIASDALSALGLMSKDPAVLAENLARINDVMAKVANTANTDIPMLWEALKPSASIVTQLGGDVEELGSMFGVLASSGMKAEKAGTALRNIYLRLTSGTREVDKVLEKLNINIEDSSGKLRPMADILEEVNKKTANMSDKTRQSALTHLFGLRAVNASMILMKAGKGTIDEYTESLRKSGGEAAELARRIGESIPNRLAALKSKLLETGLKFIDMFKDRIPGAIDNMISAIDNIDIARVVKDVQDVIEFIRKYHHEMEAIFATIIAYNVAVKAAAALQWALNIAMMANPIGLVIAAFTALGLAMYALIRYGKEIKAWFDGFWRDIAYGFAWTINMISGGNIEAAAGKGAAAFFKREQARRKALEEMERRKGYKSVADTYSERDLTGLLGEGKTSSVFGGGVADIFNKYGIAADLENQRNVEAETTSNLSGELLYGKSQSELNINFANAPTGMSVETKQGAAAPLINTNLGQQ